jgi:hypothetical protein
MFGRLNRKLAIVYRTLVIFIPPLIVGKVAKSYPIILQSLPKQTRSNALFYSLIQRSITAVLVFAAIIREIIHFDTLELIMRKRIDGCYFRRLKLVVANDNIQGGHFRTTVVFDAKTDRSSVDSYRHLLVATILSETVIHLSLEVATRFGAESEAAFKEAQLNGLEYVKFLVTFIFVEVPCLFCVYLAVVLTLICQQDGLVMISLAIVATMTDMLRRANEQLRLTHDTFGRRVNSRGAAGQELIPITELLVQVRDVLVVLRHIADISFALNTLNSLVIMLLNAGLLLALFPVNKYWHAFYCGFGFVWRLFRELSCRYVVLRFHREADKMHEICQRCLVNQSAERRVDTLTNARLAEQITQLGPSTWINYKIESLLKTSLSTLALMVCLHRIAEVGFQATRSNRTVSYQAERG